MKTGPMQDSSIAGIILAAGSSTRMGRLKPLLPFRGAPMLQSVVNTALDTELNPVIVVLGHAAERIEREMEFKTARVVRNPHHARGQSTSLQAGLAALPDTCTAAMFFLADQPLVNGATVSALTAAYHNQRPWAVVPEFRGRRGNPVIVDRTLFPRIMQLSGDTGARNIIQAQPERTIRVAVESAAIHFDVDLPMDYARLQELEGPMTGKAGGKADGS